MSNRSSSIPGNGRAPRPLWRQHIPDWLDTLAIALWGILFLRYWASGKLGLLIHPNYFLLSVGAGGVLLAIAAVNTWRLLRQRQPSTLQHITLFPPGLMAWVLIVAAMVGLIVTPRPFASETALQRGLQDASIVTRVKPQSFSVGKAPEARSLIDWIRTLDVYPEPDAYTGQPVRIKGFVVHTNTIPTQYFTLTRFVITCCAADVYPIGLPIKVATSRADYQPDQWYEVKGKMITETLNNKRQLVVQAESLTAISEPDNPYNY
jgi:uncharacterized repeat protein (TIGR03943 family)